MSRAEILRRFQEWLDGALASEEPPRGIEAEILAAVTGASREGPQPPATYSLWSAMTALAQEVKLQGRSFKELNQTLDSQADRMSERERDLLVSETERRCRKEVLGVLIDLRDRLARGLESVRTSEAGISKPVRRPEPVQPPKPVERGWLARVFSRRELPDAEQPREEKPQAEDDSAGAMLAALKKGYELSLDRLDQTLEEFQAREILCVGQAFDPRRMNAIDRQESTTVPDGTVLEVYRSGYEWNGELFRPAQVKVACAPAGRNHE
jgi:molecular chaperone GrpE